MKCKLCNSEIKPGELEVVEFTDEKKNKIHKFNRGMCPACKRDLFFAEMRMIKNGI